MKRAREVAKGDVFELAVSDGFACLQVIAKHHSHGWAVRVVSPIRAEQLVDAEADACGPDLYVVFLGDLAVSERESRLRYMGNAPVPDSYGGKIPTFRANVSYLPDGRHSPDHWWLDDGITVRRIEKLSADEQHFPLREIIPLTVLKDRIERGWDPEWEFKGAGASEFARPSRAPKKARVGHDATFFLFFAEEAMAQLAAAEIRSKLSTAQLSLRRESDSGEDAFLLTAGLTFPIDLPTLDELFEHVAATFQGDYDGNEIFVG